MKLSKRLIAVLLIVVMVLSVFAMAACEPELPNNDDNGQNNNGNNNGDNNGNNNGDNNGDNNGNNSQDSVVSGIVDVLLKEGIKPFEFNMTMTAAEVDDTYYMLADGTIYSDSETGFDGHCYSYKNDTVVIMKVLADLAKGKMDAVTKDTSVSESNYYPTSSEEELQQDYYSDADVEYYFLRNWHGFNYSNYNYSDDKDDLAALEEVTDWSDIVLEYGGSIIDGYEGMVAEYVDYVQRVNVIILNLAAAANAVTVDGNKVVVDINKLAYNMFNELNAVLNKITNNTTIGQLLNDPTIKKYLSSVLNAFTIDEVLGILEDFDLLDNEIAEQLLAVKPDENSTTYDYIVKLISSDELNDLVSDMIKAELGISLPTNIANLKLGFILDFVASAMGLPEGVDLLSIAKAYVKMVADYVTETEIKVNDGYTLDGYQGDASSTTTIKNAKMEYVLNSDKTIASQKFSIDIEESGAHSFSQVDEDLYQIGSGTSTQHIEGTIEYKSSVTFVDIDECGVEYSVQEFSDAEYDESFECWINGNDYYTEPLKGNLHVEISDGSVFELLLTDDNGEVLWSANVIMYGNRYSAALDGNFSVTLLTYNYETGESEETYDILLNAHISSRYIQLELTCDGSYVGWLSIEAPTVHYTNTVSGVVQGEDWTQVEVEE